jgi:hypothetical protein
MQQPTDPSAPTPIDSNSTRAAARANASINFRIHLTSLATQTVPPMDTRRRENEVNRPDTDVRTTKPEGFPTYCRSRGFGYCGANVNRPLNTRPEAC